MVTNDFIERLEELAFLKKQCEIVFLDEGGSVSINQRIEGIYDRGDKKVLQLQSGKEIDLSKLVKVDGFSVENIA